MVEPFKSNGKIVKTEADAKLGTTTFTLSNGAKVTYKKTDFKEDEIVFSAISLGGSSLISNEDIEKHSGLFQRFQNLDSINILKMILPNSFLGNRFL